MNKQDRRDIRRMLQARGTNWDTVGTYGLLRSNPERWKLNRHAPEGDTSKPKKQSLAVNISYPKVDPALNVNHSRRTELKRIKQKAASDAKSRAVRIARLAKQEGITPKEAARIIVAQDNARLEREYYLENR